MKRGEGQIMPHEASSINQAIQATAGSTGCVPIIIAERPKREHGTP